MSALHRNMRRSADRTIRLLELLTQEVESRVDAFLCSEAVPISHADVREMREMEQRLEDAALRLFQDSARQSRVDALKEALDEIEGLGHPGYEVSP